jgi:hypothetical protein
MRLAGGSLRCERAASNGSDVMHARIFSKSPADIAVVGRIRESFLPPRSCAVTELMADFFDPLLLVDIELVAMRPAA